MTPLALIKLLNLTSPALPIGGYSYSQGLEWAIEKGGIDTPGTIQQWIHHVLAEAIGHTDLPALKKLFCAFKCADPDGVHYWNQWILASRETQELTDEDRTVGKALLRLLKQQDITSELLPKSGDVSLITAWAFAGSYWKMPLEAAAIGFCWSWVENQIAVAGKTLPLAQSPAQSILSELMPVIEHTVTRGLSIPDDEIGQSLPGWAMASADHEMLYSRMFRS